MKHLQPLEAVAALYSADHHESSESIVASLSRVIFTSKDKRPAGRVRRTFARAFYQILRWTTTSRKSVREGDAGGAGFTNAILKRCKHGFAGSLMGSSKEENAALIEGDPMNGHYMMIAPELRMAGGMWDRIFFDSVQGKDVQLRLAWETRATYDAAKRWLDKGERVRMKAVAAGTGLSMILAYDRLVRDGYSPELITAIVTDRDQGNIEKANRLLEKLATTKGEKFSRGRGYGISAETEDIFADHGEEGPAKYDVVTAMGILEYFQGFSYATTEQRLKLEPAAASATAQDLATRLHAMTTDRSRLIINTYRNEASTRILELFGRRFHFRSREDLRCLLASANFRPSSLVGSGNIYDVEVYEKNHLPVCA
jgi:hypothetical protein